MSQTSVPPGMVKTASRGNRRATIRYRCAPATIGRVVVPGDQEFQLAWILDLSLRGIGMQLLSPVEPGRLIAISMKSSDGSKTFDLSAHVVRCNAAPHNEWYIGCELTHPITDEELDQLL